MVGHLLLQQPVQHQESQVSPSGNILDEDVLGELFGGLLSNTLVEVSSYFSSHIYDLLDG